MDKTEWITCPIFRNKTQVKIREDTELKISRCFVLNADRKV